MKIIYNDSKGHIFTGIISIFIISFFIIAILLINMNYFIKSENNEIIANDNLKYITEDYIKNIEILSYDTLEEISENAVKSKNPVQDVNKEFKKVLNDKLAQKNIEYNNLYNVNIVSDVISIENGDKPEFLKVKVFLNIKKENNEFNEIIDTKTTVLNLKDPLGLLLCEGSTYNETNVIYEDSLSNYLSNRNIENSEHYINATGPLNIKKCPYDPYIHHGDNQTLSDCIKNGYYHESSDGSCYLCRLEAKSTCPHYGFETFIIPRDNLSNNLSSVSSSDHVVFFENYPGNSYNYSDSRIIFLDNSHRLKYGL
ncbi:hypothetical protein [Methanobrevibacter sp. DSM 116169]|uniref:hypothetical protein n=1 Tax=Methanobrevibacter sp. DSM 116169 TaxID=3242727 RepID=UPI0038FBFFC6